MSLGIAANYTLKLKRLLAMTALHRLILLELGVPSSS